MTTATYPAATLLADWLCRGALDSQYSRHADSVRANPHSFYGCTLARHGKPAAEDALQASDRAERMSDLAGLIEPVAESMQMVAHTGMAEAADIEPYSPVFRPYPYSYTIEGSSQMVSICNRQLSNGPSIPGIQMFAPKGDLGLKAVALQVGRSRHGITAQLGLILPWPDAYGVRDAHSAYSVVTISTTGYTEGFVYAPILSTDSYMRFGLGLKGPADVLGYEHYSNVSLSEIFEHDIPHDYLADSVLPELTIYLTNMARVCSQSR